IYLFCKEWRRSLVKKIRKKRRLYLITIDPFKAEKRRRLSEEMNRGHVLQSSPAQQQMMMVAAAGNPTNWWTTTMRPPSNSSSHNQSPQPQPQQSLPYNLLIPSNNTSINYSSPSSSSTSSTSPSSSSSSSSSPSSSSLPLPSWHHTSTTSLPPESWSQLLLGGLMVEDEDKGNQIMSMSSHFQHTSCNKFDNHRWEDQKLVNNNNKNNNNNNNNNNGCCSSSVLVVDDMKQESSSSAAAGSYMSSYGHHQQQHHHAIPNQHLIQQHHPHELNNWSSNQTTTTSRFMDFSTVADQIAVAAIVPNLGLTHPPPLPTQPSSTTENNSINGTAGGGGGGGGTVKKARVQSSTSSTSTQSAMKVRKEKLGDRITTLHQIVSPFGKTDTASVLLEAIGYIRFLQSQIEALSLPYLGSGSSNMRHQQQQQHYQQHSVEGERNCVFPEDPGQLLNDICRKRKAAPHEQQEEAKKDLRSRGLCLVPLSCTLEVGNENNGADYWAPSLGGGFR
ncbi:Transcription factor bHLH68, partial [Linum perenne]